MSPVTSFPNGIDAGTALEADVLTIAGVGIKMGQGTVVDGAGTAATGLTTVSGFALGISGGNFGTAAQDEAYAVGGSASSGNIVLSAYASGGTAMGGTATIDFIAWGTL